MANGKSESLKSDINELKSNLNDKVSKAGDTMSGDLQTKSNNIEINEASNAWGNASVYLNDKNDARMASVRAFHFTNGMGGIQLGGHNGSAENVLRLMVNYSGTRSVGVSDSAAWRSAIGAMSQAGEDINGTDTTSGAYDYEGAIKTILTSNAPQSWAKGMHYGTIRKINSGTQTAWTGMFLLSVFNPNANWSTQGIAVVQGYIFSIWYKNGAWDVLRFALA